MPNMKGFSGSRCKTQETGKPEFHGEYMKQYSWAESTCALLWQKNINRIVFQRTTLLRFLLGLLKVTVIAASLLLPLVSGQ